MGRVVQDYMLVNGADPASHTVATSFPRKVCVFTVAVCVECYFEGLQRSKDEGTVVQPLAGQPACAKRATCQDPPPLSVVPVPEVTGHQ